MKFLAGIKLAAVAAMTFGMTAAANAATTFNFSFTAPWFLSTGSGSGQLFADVQSDGTYQITGVSGTGQSSVGATASSLTSFSGILLGGTPTISGDATTGFSLNSILLGNALTGYTVSKNLLDSNYTISSGLQTTTAGTFTLSLATAPGAVPETATWAMMILGFGGIGLALRAAPRRERVFA